MKKLFIVTLIVGGITAISSCKKDFTCECTVFGFTGDTTITDVTKKEAQDFCDNQDNAVSFVGGSCELE